MLPQDLKQGARVLQLLQEEYPGYHPLIGVAKIAHETDDKRLEFDAHKVLCDYVEPKLKSVEVSQHRTGDEELRVIFEGDFTELPKNGTPAPSLEKLPVDELMNPQELSHPDVVITQATDELPDIVKPSLTLVEE